MLYRQSHRVLGHDEVASRRDGGLVGEVVADSAIQFPAGEIDRSRSTVVEFDPLLIPLGIRDWRIGRAIDGSKDQARSEYDIRASRAELVHFDRKSIDSGHQDRIGLRETTEHRVRHAR